MRWLPLVIGFTAFTACDYGPEPLCVSTCGVELRPDPYSPPIAVSCDDFQRAEDHYVEAMSPRFDDVCARLKGRWITLQTAGVDDAGSFTDPWGRRVAEYTSCYANDVQSHSVLGWVGDFRRSGYAHGLTHGVLRCGPFGGPAHTIWRDAGIYDDLARANDY